MARRKKGDCREEVLRQFQARLVEHFDAGVGMVCWEEEGETRYLTMRFGNSFAVEAMVDQLAGCLEADTESEEEDEDED